MHVYHHIVFSSIEYYLQLQKCKKECDGRPHIYIYICLIDSQVNQRYGKLSTHVYLFYSSYVNTFLCNDLTDIILLIDFFFSKQCFKVLLILLMCLINVSFFFDKIMMYNRKWWIVLSLLFDIWLYLARCIIVMNESTTLIGEFIEVKKMKVIFNTYALFFLRYLSAFIFLVKKWFIDVYVHVITEERWNKLLFFLWVII
jgi:hypothetical protein